MPYEHSFGPGPFELTVRISGPVTLGELLDGRRRIIDDPRTRAGLSALFDYSAADAEHLTPDSVRRLAEEAHDRRLRFRAVAIVAPRDLLFGFARMFTSLAEIEGHADQHAVVRSVSEALTWLQSVGEYRCDESRS